MKWWSISAFAVGIGLLAAARFIRDPVWLNLLVGSGASFGIGIGLAAATILRARVKESWILGSALLLAIAAVGTRGALLAQIDAKTPQISLWQLLAAGASVAWGAVGLLFGSQAISSLFSGQRKQHLRLALAGAAVTLCLFAVAPLWRVIDVRVNHWTLIGLFGIAAFSYGCSTAYRWLVDRLLDRDKR